MGSKVSRMLVGTKDPAKDGATEEAAVGCKEVSMVGVKLARVVGTAVGTAVVELEVGARVGALVGFILSASTQLILVFLEDFDSLDFKEEHLSPLEREVFLEDFEFESKISSFSPPEGAIVGAVVLLVDVFFDDFDDDDFEEDLEDFADFDCDNQLSECDPSPLNFLSSNFSKVASGKSGLAKLVCSVRKRAILY